jgi:hypothetical protein
MRGVFAWFLAAAHLLGPACTSGAFANDMICAEAPYADAPEVADFVAEMTPVFSKFPTLEASLATDAPELGLAGSLHTARGYFEPETRRIVIERALSPGLRQAVLVHELRHAQQFATGSCPGPGLSMQGNARAIFAMEADASVVSMLVAWRMREAGAPAMWDALASWPMQEDIADAFSAEMAAHDDPARAAGAAFAQWYANAARRDRYYVAICSNYLDHQDSTHRLPAYGDLAPDFFAELCRLPDGTAYRCDDSGAAGRD